MLTLGVTACALSEEPADPETSEADQAIAATNKLAGNKLAANKLAANKLAANKLAAASFAAGTQAQPLVDTADGRDVLTYMLQCALSPSQSLTFADSTGVKWTFAGQIGVAPAWTTRALTVTEQRWVTACLLARVNYFGVVVNLSLQGDLQALKTTAADKPFTDLDGAFYGNLFDPAGPKEYACDGPSTSTVRVCADPDPATNGTQTMCGFVEAGTCASGTSPACTLVSGKIQCRTALTNAASTVSFQEVIGVFLVPN
ncbi:MAG: hypothetical protein QM831_25015 [Kofleriaceae bacterium]